MSQSCLTATELFALPFGAKCSGPENCHWCGAPCERLFIHDGPVPLPFVKNDPTARYPAHPYICNGCRLFRRTRTTLRFLDGKAYKDRQCPLDHSLFVTNEGAYGIRQEDYPLLWSFLLRPPLRFALSLITKGQRNHLQLALVNDFQQIRADTPLRFSYNNVPHSYSVYEVKEAIQSGDAEGKEPGVRVLAELLGLPTQEKRGRGRPTLDEKNDPNRIVSDVGWVRKSA